MILLPNHEATIFFTLEKNVFSKPQKYCVFSTHLMLDLELFLVSFFVIPFHTEEV